MERRTDIFLEEIADELENNILPYWLTLSDPEGGFYGEADARGVVHKDAPRGSVLYSRIIRTFAAAYGSLGKKEYLDAAVHARNWFVEHLEDNENGGVFWSVTSDGKPLDSKKQLYAQGFAVYGLSELYKVTGDKADLEAAVDLFRLVEDRFADREDGGYVEALSRDFSPLEDMSLSAHDINAGKTMNSHLHILEAWANLYEVWPDPSLRKSIVDLVGLLCRKIAGPDGHLRLYFDKDWSVLPGAVSFGHDIATSWLLLECTDASGGAGLTGSVMPYSLSLGLAGNEGLLDDGSMMYELLPDGTPDLSRQWWVQAEAVVGNLWLWKRHGMEEGLANALRCWDWIRENLVDRTCGEWFWGVGPDGVADLGSPKAGIWKCPYHNSRMCLEVMKLFD